MNEFQKYDKHSDAEKRNLSPMYTQHMGSRWYTPDLQVVTTDT